MSIFSSANIVAGASGKNQRAYIIEESLRFNASQNSYLRRTPTSTGNRKTWTYSCWFKIGLMNSTLILIEASDNTGTTVRSPVRVQSGGGLQVSDSASGLSLTTTQLFRDPSAWYHVVLAVDTTQATASNRAKMYINGAQVTSFSAETYPTLNADTLFNSSSYMNNIGSGVYWTSQAWDGYMTEVHFIDGQALDPLSFGEFDSVTGVWKPAERAGSYGTNGFYLPMQLDNTVEGFNTVTYLGTGSTQRIRGVGFSPDFVWYKRRDSTASHQLYDSVRGATKTLFSDSTNAESTGATRLQSFDTDGFTLGSDGGGNASGGSYVAWCWDAGSSTVSNTDGSITSNVRANPTYGFSVVTYTGTGANATVGHGLGAAPKMVIAKRRDTGPSAWVIAFDSSGFTWSSDYYQFDTGAKRTDGASTVWRQEPTSSVFSVGSSFANTGTYVTYCFSEIAGYSKFGSYTGTGASGNTVTLGFRPAFLLIKETGNANSWELFDNTRSPVNPVSKRLFPNDAQAEATTTSLNFTDTGFETLNGNTGINRSGGTYIYMAFKDTREYAFWLDDSGNNNDWQPNGGITTNSTVTDTPTPYEDGGNYAVINPLDYVGSGTLSQGNLYYTGGGSGVFRSTIGIPDNSNKFYFEITQQTAVNPYNPIIYGLASLVGAPSHSAPQRAAVLYCDAGTGHQVSIYDNGSYITGVNCNITSIAVGDILQFAYDSTSGNVWVGKNNAWCDASGGSTGNPSTGANPTYTFTLANQPLTPTFDHAGVAYQASLNCGQRPFAYTPPTGFKPLHTGNLPDSAIVDGSQYFAVDTYTGTGVAQTRTLGFEPGLVWNKIRSQAYDHNLQDVLRGTGVRLISNSTDQDLSITNCVTAFNSDGYSVGNYVSINGSGESIVNWAWKANGAGVSNTDGSITSTVSANPTSGFSIVTYTGTGANATVGHGLGAAPDMVIVKKRSGASAWLVYHSANTSAPATDYLELNTTSATVDNASVWNDIEPTSSVFSIGTAGAVNTNTATYVAYCFADVEGYSKFGSYTGNGSSDGSFVYLGFRPKFVMIKLSSGVDNWAIFDASRIRYNPDNNELLANTSGAEGTADFIDIVSNGFKNRNADSRCNASGSTYIYMAFAENPFKNSLAR